MSRTTALSLSFLVLVLAACGGAATQASTGSQIAATATEFAFKEGSWTVPAGQPVALTLKNEGAVEHEWVIVKAGETVSVPFDDDDEAKVYWEIEAEPGETKTETFTAPPAGTYTIVCGVPGHLEAGMQGTLVVK